jgi:hypothetical protein
MGARAASISTLGVCLARTTPSMATKKHPHDSAWGRFGLVGFWLHYRAANHLGGAFSTVPERWNLERHPWTRNQAMVATFNAVFGRPIKDTADYLAVLGCTSHDRLWRMVRRGMARYVLDGHDEDADDAWPGVRRA